MVKKRKKAVARLTQSKKAQSRKAEKDLQRGKGRADLLKTVSESVEKQLKEFASVVDNRLNNVIQTMLGNQKGLATSHEQLDQQFAVLTRLLIVRHNDLVARYNMIIKASIDVLELNDAEIPMVAPIDWEEVLGMFGQFIELRQRPDYADHMETWYMGGDVSNLPPIPEPPAAPEVQGHPEEDEGSTETPEEPETVVASGYPEGAQIFGGDYGEESGQQDEKSPNGDESTEAGAERRPDEDPPVPPLQEQDDPPDQSEHAAN